ncbi:hypothetical protein I552_6021 [Mycobacterium xenopi 3993]|nr:hypothetical protein I552_6021 [Mycobacterium xenopi 3993]
MVDDQPKPPAGEESGELTVSSPQELSSLQSQLAQALSKHGKTIHVRWWVE